MSCAALGCLNGRHAASTTESVWTHAPAGTKYATPLLVSHLMSSHHGSTRRGFAVLNYRKVKSPLRTTSQQLPTSRLQSLCNTSSAVLPLGA
jgi:hypothetical protein